MLDVSPIVWAVSLIMFDVSGIDGATVVEVSVIVDVESPSVPVPSPELQAAKAPIAKTIKSFFIVVNVLCVSEFDIYTETGKR